MSEDCESFETLQPDEVRKVGEIKRLGDEIRRLKLELATDGGQDGRSDGDSSEIPSLVSAMDSLKKEVRKPLSKEIDRLLGRAEERTNDDGPGPDPGEERAKELCDLLPSCKPKKNFEKRLRALRKSREAATSARFDAGLHTENLRIQRKIHHLLESEGSGDDFVYFPDRIATAAHGLVPNDPDRPVVLTEKWDGTTVQATNRGVFQRRDKFRRGDPNKFGASEEDRYGIERLDVGFDEFLARRRNGVTAGGEANRTRKGDKTTRHIREACERYFPAFASLDEGLCVYFEAVGTSIQSRYKPASAVVASSSGGEADDGAAAGGGWHDIRVFDFARDGRFLPWRDACDLAEGLGLPVVGHAPPAPLDLPTLLRTLASAPRYAHPVDPDHPSNRALLEGYVVRGVHTSTSGLRGNDGDGCVAATQEEPIAKIRVEDLAYFR